MIHRQHDPLERDMIYKIANSASYECLSTQSSFRIIIFGKQQTKIGKKQQNRIKNKIYIFLHEVYGNYDSFFIIVHLHKFFANEYYYYYYKHDNKVKY